MNGRSATATLITSESCRKGNALLDIHDDEPLSFSSLVYPWKSLELDNLEPRQLECQEAAHVPQS